MSSSLLRIAACSYEGSLFGWKVTVDDTKPTSEETEGEAGFASTMDFGFNCSAGALKCVAISAHGKYLCCGGTDERIRIFNMAENRSMGELGLHEGAITSLAFFDDSHLISGSEDSSLRIWRCHDWECLHVLHGHKAAITSVAIHPTGKIALSVSKDNTMKLWNLIQGRCSFTRRLKGPADKVHWHSSGLYYMLIVVNEVQVYRAADNECVATIKHKTRVNQAVFCLCGRPILVSETSDSNDSAGQSKSKKQDKDQGQGKGDVKCDAEGIDDEVDSSMLHVRVASVCEDKTLFLHNMEGVETARLDMQDLHGRPRDMWACPLTLALSATGQGLGHSSSSSSSTATAAATAAAALEGEGDGLVVASSQSTLVVLSCRAVEEGHSMDECSLVSMQTRAEPRLTCVVAWSTSASGNATTSAAGSSSNNSDSTIAKAGKQGTKQSKTSVHGVTKQPVKNDNRSNNKSNSKGDSKGNKSSTTDSSSSNNSNNNSKNKGNNNADNSGKQGKHQDKTAKKSGEKRIREESEEVEEVTMSSFADVYADDQDEEEDGDKKKKPKMQKLQQPNQGKGQGQGQQSKSSHAKGSSPSPKSKNNKKGKR